MSTDIMSNSEYFRGEQANDQKRATMEKMLKQFGFSPEKLSEEQLDLLVQNLRAEVKEKGNVIVRSMKGLLNTVTGNKAATVAGLSAAYAVNPEGFNSMAETITGTGSALLEVIPEETQNSISAAVGSTTEHIIENGEDILNASAGLVQPITNILASTLPFVPSGLGVGLAAFFIMKRIIKKIKSKKEKQNKHQFAA